MTNINEKILDGSQYVEDCYAAQTRAFGPGEYRFINRLIAENSTRTVLDIGTGEGTFLRGLAGMNPTISFIAIDADPRLIAEANLKNGCKNIRFVHAAFGDQYPPERFDLILTRFAVEHMPDVAGFVAEAHRRLNPGGILLITEYYIDHTNSTNQTWTLFRQHENAFYNKYGSHPRVAPLLIKYLAHCGFAEIDTIYRQISPSTVGHEVFYNLVKTYAILYHNLDSEAFPGEVMDRVVAYADQAAANPEAEDGLLISHTTGRRPG